MCVRKEKKGSQLNQQFQHCANETNSRRWIIFQVRRTRGWSRPTSMLPSTPLPRWSARRSSRAASSPLTLISASTGTLATSQVAPSSLWLRLFSLSHLLFSPAAGIDLAFIENGFIYHTKYDTADRILTDSIQRAGRFQMTSPPNYRSNCGELSVSELSIKDASCCRLEQLSIKTRLSGLVV